MGAGVCSLAERIGDLEKRPGGLEQCCRNLEAIIWASAERSISPSGAFGQYTGAGSGTATTFPVTATPTDGIAPYTYQWSYVSGDATTSCTSATASTTTFSRTGTAPAGPYNAVWKCTVTDSAGNTGDSAHITVTTLFT